MGSAAPWAGSAPWAAAAATAADAGGAGAAAAAALGKARRAAARLLAAQLEGAAAAAVACVLAPLQPAHFDTDADEDDLADAGISMVSAARQGPARSDLLGAAPARGGSRVAGVVGWSVAAAMTLAAAASAAHPAHDRGPWRTLVYRDAPAAADAPPQPSTQHRAAQSLRAMARAPSAAPHAAQRAACAAPLDVAGAHQLLLRWQAARAAALGPAHDTAALEGVLAEPLLNAWRQQALQGSIRGE